MYSLAKIIIHNNYIFWKIYHGGKSFPGYICAAFADFSADTVCTQGWNMALSGYCHINNSGKGLPCSKKYINSYCSISYLKAMLCVKWNSVAQGIFAANLCISENHRNHDLQEFLLLLLWFSFLRLQLSTYEGTWHPWAFYLAKCCIKFAPVVSEDSV